MVFFPACADLISMRVCARQAQGGVVRPAAGGPHNPGTAVLLSGRRAGELDDPPSPPVRARSVHPPLSRAQDSCTVLLHWAGDVHESADEHRCLILGRQPDGGLADGGLAGIWRDARAHLDGHFVAYVPRCECGWTGPPFSCTPGGYAACEQLWRDKHLQPFLRAREPHDGRPSTTWRPRVIRGSLASELG